MNAFILERMYHLSLKLKRVMMEKFDDSLISKGEFVALQVISRFGGDPDMTTTSVLSEKLGISKPAVSQMANALEEKGYIERSVNPNDRRHVRMLLTQQGRKMLERQERLLCDEFGGVFDRLGAEDAERLMELLEKCANLLDD